MTCRLVLILLLLSVGGVRAQTTPPETTPYRHYTTAEGLPHENILALAQGADHRLYVGTLLGLAVHDGERVQTVSFPDSISSHAVHELAPAPDGTVWASVGSHTVVQVEGRWIQRSFSVQGGIEDVMFHRDTLYAFTGGDGYWTLASGAERPVHHSYSFRWSLWRSPGDSTSGRGVENATVSPTGEIWIVDGRRGPGRLRSDGRVRFAEVPEGWAGHWWTRLEFVDSETALLTRSDEVYEFDSDSGQVRHLFTSPGPLVTYRRDEHVTYMKGKVRRRLSTNEGLRPPSALGIPISTANHAIVDHEGSLWLGAKTGLFQLYAQGVRHRTRIGETTLANVGAFSRHEDGTLWATSWGSGLIRVRPDPTVVQPQGESRWTYVASGADAVHSLSAAGWYRYERQRGWHRVGPFKQAVRGVVDANGRGYFWHDDGLYTRSVGDGAALDTLFRWPTEDRNYTAVGPHQKGGFVLRVRDELYRARFEEDGAPPILQRIARLPGYEKAEGRFLEADRRGRVWLAFWERGLVRVDPRPSPPTIDSLLVDRPVRRVILSGDSLALVTALDGLYMVDPKRFRLERHLTTDDGLLGTTTGGATFLQDTLYISHHAGLTKMPGQALTGRSSAPRVLLTSLERGGMKRPIVGDSVLEANQKALAFNFSAPTYRAPGRVRYQYRLRPTEDQWTHSTRAFARYTNLPPGDYRFEVKADLRHGPVGPRTTYTFRVPPQFYETTWFRLLVGLALLGLAVGGYRWRVHRLRRRKDELENAVDARTQQLRKEKQKTEEQAQRLAELDEAKNRFFANVSHEFRTPLTLIAGPLQALLSEEHGPITEAQAQRLRQMRKSVDRLLDLIGQLLDLARLEAGQMQLQPSPGELIHFIEQRIRAFEPLCEREGITLHFRSNCDHLPLRYDPDKLQKVFDNLLSNAVSFTPEGGEVWVTVRVVSEDSRAEIVVKDTGPGIPEEDIEQLFGRFQMGGGASNGDRQGAGIGLSLARELVELHGGAIRVRSEPGYGAAFIVRLPVDDSVSEGEDAVASAGTGDDTASEPPMNGERSSVPSPLDAGAETRDDEIEDAPSSSTQGDGQVATILVVDDNDEVRALLRHQFTPTYAVLEADDGRTALEIARQEQPDLILSDVMMPGMDGLEFCEAVKTDNDLAAIPVLLLTAKAGPRSEKEGLKHGADAYVEKPFDATVLRARVQNLLANRRRLKQAFGNRVLVESSGEAISEETATLLENVLESVEEHLGDAEFSVEDLAAEVALSRRQLSRRLKEVTGESPGVLIRRIRLQRAAEMLENGARSVSEVAFAVGYESPSHFARAFRKRFGCAPSEYDGAE